MFQLIGWPGRRILPGEAKESPRNALTSGNVQPRARAHLHTRAHPCTSLHRCTSPISHTLHPSHTPQAGRRVSYTPTTQAHSGIHGAAPHATRDPDGGKAGVLRENRRGISIFQTGLARVNCWVRVPRGSRAYSVSRTQTQAQNGGTHALVLCPLCTCVHGRESKSG